MITLNDIFLGKVTLNPLHINFMRKSYSRKLEVRDAQTLLIYCLPDQHAIKYYVKESIAEIINNAHTTGNKTTHESKQTT